MLFFWTAQDMESMGDDDGWEFVNLGDQQSFGIKTAGLEEKATACQMLVGITCIEMDFAVENLFSPCINSSNTL